MNLRVDKDGGAVREGAQLEVGADAAALCAELTDGEVRLVPLADAHVEPLRAACAEDPAIWDIYPYSLLGEHFDPAIAARRKAAGVNFAACRGGEVVGMTSYLRPDPAQGVVDIGGSYIVPRLRGTGYNRRMKRLMIDHAFACGFRRIEFRVDERNGRSQAAVLKLGARREGLLRQDRITWTGHVRNTCIFGLLREDWAG
jgi:RimJ/RimL family protein N-acetyltransferase